MNNILNKTHAYFFVFSLIILLVAFRNPKQTFDINIHDTYYIIQNLQIGVLLFLAYCILGIIHLYIDQRGIPIKNWILYAHTFLSIGAMILVWILIRKLNENYPQTVAEILKSIRTNQILTYTSISLIVVLILTQFTFIINVLIHVFKNQTHIDK
jgi:hypothetical protein